MVKLIDTMLKQYSTSASGVGKGYSHGCCCLRHSASSLQATAEHHPWEYPLPTPLGLVLYCLISNVSSLEHAVTNSRFNACTLFKILHAGDVICAALADTYVTLLRHF